MVTAPISVVYAEPIAHGVRLGINDAKGYVAGSVFVQVLDEQVLITVERVDEAKFGPVNMIVT